MPMTTATGGTAADQAQEVGARAKEQAQEARVRARSRVRDEVDRRSTEAGHQAGSAAQALRDASTRLRDDGNEPVARGFEQVADRVERAGGWLRDADGDSILRDVEDFGRRNSLAVVAGGLAIGFAASRLLKASSRRRYESSGGAASVPRAERPPATNGPGFTPPPPVAPGEGLAGTPGTPPSLQAGHRQP